MAGLPAPALAARRLAARLVERHDLRPPIDVRALLERHADVVDIEWPFEDFDALVIGLGRHRPRVFLSRSPHGRRRRFTMAHELAHVLLPWHAGSVGCTPDYDTYGLPTYGEEQQADVFASCLMVPDRWVGHLIATHGQDMDSLLRETEAANLSAYATVLALRRNLFAGWVFVISEGSDQRIIGTPGTAIPDGARGPLGRKFLRAAAQDSGTVVVQDRPVAWYRMYEVADMPDVAADDRGPTQILRDVLREVTEDAAREKSLEQKLNGKIGGILREAAGRPAHELFTTLEYRLAREGYEDLLALPDFRSWLAHKAHAVSSGTTKRRRS